MTPVESTDAQMSKPVTKGETRVLSTVKNLGWEGAELSPPWGQGHMDAVPMPLPYLG